MMFSDEEIKEKHLTRQGDEIISIKKVCVSDRKKRDLDEYYGPLSPLSKRKEQTLREGYFPLDAESISWSEDLMVSQSFGSTCGSTQPSFGKDSDATWKREIKDEYNTPVSRCVAEKFQNSTKKDLTSSVVKESPSSSKSKLMVDKSDPRSRLHYVKLVRRNGRTVKFWECGMCGRDFLHQYTLMRHLPTHTDERNFRCDECSKSFRQLSTLSQHRAIHSDDRPYGCEVCSKTFNRLSTLISHRKTHSGEKPYKCHVCDKGFHQKGNLRNHMFTHTNERPYRCDVCMKGFNQQSNLVCHKIKAHPEAGDSNIKRDNSIKVRSISQLLEKSEAINPPQNSEVSSSTFGFASLDLSISERSIESHQPPQDDTSNGVLVNPIDACTSNRVLVNPIDACTSNGVLVNPIDACTSNGVLVNSIDACTTNGVLVNPIDACTSNGVLVDPITTYHMEVALAAKQTPFALIKLDDAPPVLVKVIDVKYPQGKQMLVPATAEDLMCGGRIVSDDSKKNEPANSETHMSGIRVPVVAVVVGRLNEGRLRLSVEEPHHAYPPPGDEEGKVDTSTLAGHPSCEVSADAACCPPSPPSPPSPPLDIALELFDNMEIMPMNSRPLLDNDLQPHASDKLDITDIDEFRDIILLSDSE